MDLTLRHIAQMIRSEIIPENTEPVRSVSIDTRTLKKGGLFIALPGECVDGHAYVGQAVGKGACAAIVHRDKKEAVTGVDSRHLLPVEDPLRALQDLASGYRQSFSIPVIAVTGTNGKTSTKEMIAAVMEKKFRILKSPGNLNNHIGMALGICLWEREGEVAVIEMGMNHPGEIRRLCEIAEPTHGVITNIGKGHLQYLDSLEGVAKAKSELLESLIEGGEAFLNGDDPYLFPLRIIVRKTTTFGLLSWCDLRGEEQGLDDSGHPMLTVGGEKICLPVLGRHNLSNGLAAAAVGRAFGIAWPDIKEALESYRPVNKRMEVVSWSDIRVINDTYNANPGSVEQALMTLNELPSKGRKLAVLGDMLELGEHSREEHQIIGKWVFELKLDLFYGFGQEMHHACDWAIDLGMKKVSHFKSKPDLIEQLLAVLKPGDTVLVKGSRGMQMEEIVQGIKEQFSS